MRGMYKPLDRCRISGSKNLIPVLHLGSQELTGVFPKPGEAVTEGPLDLVWCPDSGLLQLAHTYDSGEMYGDNYGYRSGLNASMVRHLSEKIAFLERLVDLKPGDSVLDIGSNDATSLKSYRTPDLTRIGIDPTGRKFQQYYPDDIRLVPDFFNAANYRSVNDRPARIVTSIAMFYDLDDPVAFARDVASILAPDGVWHFEQSYMPAMLRTISYDTICHEHLEYYSLSVVRRIVEAAGLKLIDVQMNGINGGSFAVTAAPAGSNLRANDTVINWLLGQEERMGLHTVRPFREFEDRVFRHRQDLTRLLKDLATDGKRVLGYGASTKGNVTLQFCGITEAEVPAIAEVNPEKFGRVTPGTRIPIISEAEARASNPDYFLVLPWHFKEGILQRETEFRLRGGRFIFPFPEIEII
ncbi:Methyltransferase domain-containing protein [Methylobacterium sp. UNCCL125]|nr:Methyltransferase domain-containing protein [Methylobacterium sp. UNCCL125]